MRKWEVVAIDDDSTSESDGDGVAEGKVMDAN